MQPAQRVGIEMVGRLVEQQDGGMPGAGFGDGEEDTEPDPTPFAGGQSSKRPVQNMVGR